MNGTIDIITVFIAGLLSFFAPCILPVLPVYLSVLTETVPEKDFKTPSQIKVSRWMPVLKTVAFVIGVSVTFLILGFGAGKLGGIINKRGFQVLCGLVVILLGLHQVGLLQIRLLNREKKFHIKQQSKMNLAHVFLLGLTFSFGWTPCIGPILGAVLGLIINRGNGNYGIWLMLIYILGFMAPFILVTIFSQWLLKFFKQVRKYIPMIQKIGGVIIILMGVLLVTDHINSLIAWIPY